MIAESAVDPKVLKLVEQSPWRAAAHGARFELVIALKAPEKDKAHRSR
ncbi:MAG TPA: hypothetical protein VIW19_05230 [Gaiellaceae bacterium]|jgi:hypothetical protein